MPTNSGRWTTFSSHEAEILIERALDPIITATGSERTTGNMDLTRVANIRLLAHVRSTQAGMEVRDRCIWSMLNVYEQITNDNLKDVAKVVIITAKRS